MLCPIRLRGEFATTGHLDMLGRSEYQSSPHFGFLAPRLELTGEFPEVIGLIVNQESVSQATLFEECQAFWVRVTFDPEEIVIEVGSCQ